ncbi:MAG TPA: LytTR family DNA-binding domain-containing protein [Denitromonas sp.]|uniref:LytR/AlgR family response regulator transcription factor n=1 Tax=Denitromonas sp. TaxID=2734609 RepID=UPI001D6D5951|nr:response regulator transcription factor [Rhodocyclaceae bacterium]MCP5221552.1 response regulator transcription factor [Zoogloeaceae bacterium]HPR07575.1 LytTR family DNA-binding domain-containing protein [Denitromonas sp.]HQU88674.1 LytTR family DNA-binding domain-containing protein [Denitromonas sp.]HQV15206.1 LytTR family DNA-binding domain-containing protein [Denitromonas sp.]
MTQAELRVLIVDDEAPARARLRDVLGDVRQEQPTRVVGFAANGEEALRLIEAEAVDVVLADIRMPGMDGVSLAQHLNGRADPPVVIFTTAYDQYAVQAFDLAVADYLLKPVRASRLVEALEKARKLCQGAEARTEDEKPLSVTERGRILLVDIGRVLYLRAEQKYVTARTVEREYLLDDSLVRLEESYPGRFLRIHRNCLVARKAIAGIEREAGEGEGRWLVVLAGLDEHLPISRRQWPSVKAILDI